MVTAINATQAINTPTTSNSTQTSDILIAESCDTRSKYYGKFSEKQVSDSWDKVAAREYAAFGYFGNDASSEGLKKYAEAYLNYVKGLSPEEQNSVRYKGTKESMTRFLAQVEGEIAKEKHSVGTEKKTKVPKNLLDMFTEFENNRMKRLSKANRVTNTTGNSDKVTLSEEAKGLDNIFANTTYSSSGSLTE